MEAGPLNWVVWGAVAVAPSRTRRAVVGFSVFIWFLSVGAAAASVWPLAATTIYYKVVSAEFRTVFEQSCGNSQRALKIGESRNITHPQRHIDERYCSMLLCSCVSVSVFCAKNRTLSKSSCHLNELHAALLYRVLVGNQRPSVPALYMCIYIYIYFAQQTVQYFLFFF